jgi:hypothetical protein
MRVIVKPLLSSSSYINKVDSSNTPKNPLYLRENRSILSARKYKLARILASLGNKNPPIVGGKSLTYYIFLYLL